MKNEERAVCLMAECNLSEEDYDNLVRDAMKWRAHANRWHKCAWCLADLEKFLNAVGKCPATAKKEGE